MASAANQEADGHAQLLEFVGASNLVVPLRAQVKEGNKCGALPVSLPVHVEIRRPPPLLLWRSSTFRTRGKCVQNDIKGTLPLEPPRQVEEG